MDDRSPEVWNVLAKELYGRLLVTGIKANMKNRLMPLWDKIMLCKRACSPAYKFADTRERVGHWHKLPKLVEKSNKLISGIRGNFTAAESLTMCHGKTNLWIEAVLYFK